MRHTRAIRGSAWGVALLILACELGFFQGQRGPHRLVREATPSVLLTNATESQLHSSRFGSPGGGPSIFATTVPMTEEAKSGRSPSVLLDSVIDRESNMQTRYRDTRRRSSRGYRRRVASRSRSERRRRRRATPQRRTRHGEDTVADSRREEDDDQGGGWSTKTMSMMERSERPPDSGIQRYGNGKFCFDPVTGQPRPGSVFRHKLANWKDPMVGCYPSKNMLQQNREEGARELEAFQKKMTALAESAADEKDKQHFQDLASSLNAPAWGAEETIDSLKNIESSFPKDAKLTKAAIDKMLLERIASVKKIMRKANLTANEE